MEPDVHIAIAAFPEGASLKNEVRLVKPALLYADRVTVFSPTTVLYASISHVAASTGESDRLAVIRELLPILGESDVGEVLKAVDTYELLLRKKRRSKEELLLIMKFRSSIEETWQKLGAVSEKMVADAGGNELVVALESGLVEIDPLIRTEGPKEFWDELSKVFVERLDEILSSGSAYPLFDDETGSLVKAGVAEGLLQPSAAATEKGKEIGAASEFMSALPAFPAANVSEILDIRSVLREPLVRFRAGMLQIGIMIDSSSYEDEFHREVEILYRKDVEPALLEIHERVKENKYLEQLMGSTVRDVKGFLTEGVLALVAASALDVPELAAAGVATGAPALKAAWAKRQEAREIRKEQFYFLYRTNKLLS